MKLKSGPKFYVDMPENWWHGREVQCKLCQTVFVLTPDSHVEPGNYIPGEDYKAIHFHCPVCNKRMCELGYFSNYLKPINQIEVTVEPTNPTGFFARLLK